MPKSLGSLWALALCSMLLGRVAIGGPLPTDPAAIAGAKGSAVFNGTNIPLTNSFQAIVDFAVYAPGAFSTSIALGLPADISGGSQYIYAYEIFNIGVDESLSLMSVGLFPGAVANNATLVTHLPGTPEGGIAPVNSSFNPASINPKSNVRWTFNSSFPIPDDLAIGEHSDILIFASPNPPQWKVSGITGTGSTIASELLPSPVPEPATYALAAIGAMCVMAIRSLRRRLC